MRTVTFKSVLMGIAERAGLSPETADLSLEEACTITEFINSRLREAWEWAWWPELMAVAQRYYRPAWDAATAYLSDEEVYYDGDYYTCIAASVAEEPSLTPSAWELTADLQRYVPLEQTGNVSIGEVKRVTRRDPRLDGIAWDIEFEPTADGIRIIGYTGASVWMEFRRRPPTFSAIPWNVTTNYSAGELCYLPATGECYQALQAAMGQDPATATTYWEEVEFPYIFGEFVKGAAFGDWLDAEGQGDKADAKRNSAYGALARAELAVFGQQGVSQRAEARVG